MYLPEHFREAQSERLLRLIEDYPLGIVFTAKDGQQDAHHLPILLDTSDPASPRLLAHVARGNPLASATFDGQPVLVVFTGANAYVSPSWYPGKAETERKVPTWNYRIVHAHGIMRVRDDESFVRGVVARLTRRHESKEVRPWSMGEAPADYMNAMLTAIVGIEIEITALIGKSKLDQDEPQRDRDGAADELERRGHDELAQAMREPYTASDT